MYLVIYSKSCLNIQNCQLRALWGQVSICVQVPPITDYKDMGS